MNNQLCAELLRGNVELTSLGDQVNQNAFFETLADPAQICVMPQDSPPPPPPLNDGDLSGRLKSLEKAIIQLTNVTREADKSRTKSTYVRPPRALRVKKVYIAVHFCLLTIVLG